MRIVLISKRRMKIRLAMGYDSYCLSEQYLMKVAGKSSKTTPRTSSYSSYPFKFDGARAYILKHFVGKVIK